MTRRVFPNDGATLAYLVTDSALRPVVAGTVISVYTDAAATIPADCQHMDGTAVSVGAPLQVNAYSQLPLWRGPDDSTDTLYVVVAGGPPTAVYARTDDRLDTLDAVTAVLGHADDASAIAAATGTLAVRRLIIVTDVDQPGILVMGANDAILKPLIQVKDYLGAVIEETDNAGGQFLNDQFRQHRYVLSAPTNFLSIYGYRLQNGLAEFSWDGPPGNMLSFANACQEVFEGSRAASKGDWTVAFGSGSQVITVAETGPSTSANVVQFQAHTTSMTAITGTGVFGYPVTAGGTHSTIAHIKAVATARSPQVGIQWFDSGGAFISTTVGSTTATNTGTYTKVVSGSLTAPGGAVYGAPVIVWPTTVNGELHKVSGVAMYKSNETEWSPPFVVQPLNTWGQSAAGDIWRRSSTPTVQNQRTYICTTGGLPHQQVWASDTNGLATTARQIIAGTGLTGGGDLSADRTLAVAYGTSGTTAAVGNDSRITGAAQKASNLSDLASAGTARTNLALDGAWTDYTPTLTNVTLGNGTNSGRWKQITPSLIAFRTLLTLGSTSSINGAVSIGLPTTVSTATATPYCQARIFDTSAGAIWNAVATVGATSVGTIIATAGGTTGVNATTPMTWATGDTLAVFGLLEV